MKTATFLVSFGLLSAISEAQAGSASGGVLVTLESIRTTDTATFSWNRDDIFLLTTNVNELSERFEESIYSETVAGSTHVDYTFSPHINPHINKSSATVTEGGLSSQMWRELIEGEALASINTIAWNSGNAFAQTFSELGFDVDGSGLVTLEFTVAYTAGIGGQSNEDFLSGAIDPATSGISFYANDSFGGEVSQSFFLDLMELGNDNLDGGVDLRYNLTFLVDGAASGALTVKTESFSNTGASAVPLPAAAWLLLTSFAGLFSISRRKVA